MHDRLSPKIDRERCLSFEIPKRVWQVGWRFLLIQAKFVYFQETLNRYNGVSINQYNTSLAIMLILFILLKSGESILIHIIIL